VWLYLIPGVAGFFAGLCVMGLLAGGPFLFLGRYWDLHVMVFSSMFTILSYQLILMGSYAHIFAVQNGFLKEARVVAFLQRYFDLEKGLLIGFLFFALGAGINVFIFAEWFSHKFGALYRIREAVLAMTFLIVGLQTMFSSFFLSLLFMKKR
jgi:hypothetical protein